MSPAIHIILQYQIFLKTYIWFFALVLKQDIFQVLFLFFIYFVFNFAFGIDKL